MVTNWLIINNLNRLIQNLIIKKLIQKEQIVNQIMYIIKIDKQQKFVLDVIPIDQLIKTLELKHIQKKNKKLKYLMNKKHVLKLILIIQTLNYNICVVINSIPTNHIT